MLIEILYFILLANIKIQLVYGSPISVEMEMNYVAITLRFTIEVQVFLNPRLQNIILVILCFLKFEVFHVLIFLQITIYHFPN